MNDPQAWRLVVVLDLADDHHASVVQCLLRHAPAGWRVDIVSGIGDQGVPAEVLASDTVLILDAEWLRPLVMRRDEGRYPARLVVFLDARYPRNDPRFASVYHLADAVLFEDEGLWRRMGCPVHTGLLPHCVDENFFERPPGADKRGNHTLWLVPSEADFPFRYEPWLPGPEHTVEGTEFQDEVVPFPQAGGVAERAVAYRRAAVVVCAAETLQARRHALEAAACGCAIVVTQEVNEAGVIRDGVTGLEVASEGRAMLAAIREARQRRAGLSAEASVALSARGWPAQAQGVFAALKGPVSHEASIDLTGRVTVFVATVGAPGFDACMAHLARQDCRFRLQVIDRVAPMSAAFQRMLDDCGTPYYVQVDEDMMLYRDAVRRLHAFIVAAPSDTAVAVAYLHDTFLGHRIQGVKIFRHDVARRYPLADVRSCEMDQLERMRREGWRAAEFAAAGAGEERTPALGLHDMPRDPRTIYERFRTLELARRQHRRRLKYLERWPAMFVERYLRHGDPLDAHALLGMLSVGMSEEPGLGHEKDFRAYSDVPGFAQALAFMTRAARSASD